MILNGAEPIGEATKCDGRLVGTAEPAEQARQNPGPASGQTYPLTLSVASAIGRGRTELAAFDRALVGVGAANFNLVRLSSVIPPGSSVVESARCAHPQASTWGDRLYVVYAEQRTSSPGVAVWAGVGWVQDRQSGQGLFVEHEGDDEWNVRNDITASLEDLQRSRSIDFGPMQMCVGGTECRDTPVCALVLCSFQSEAWSDAGRR